MTRTDLFSARTPLVLGFSAAIVLVGGLGAWAVQTEIAGAVVAMGAIEVENERQVVQHPDGGVVAEILARDGDEVDAGDVVLRLDDALLRTELSVIEGQLAEIFARKTRYAAERDGRELLETGALPAFSSVTRAEVEERIAGQRHLFEARKGSLARTLEMIDEQRNQILSQIGGLSAQRSAVGRQLGLTQQELDDVRALFERGLVQTSRLLELQRAEADLQGSIGAITAQIAEAEARISGLEIESLRLIDQRQETAISHLRDISVNERELLERRRALLEQVSRLDIIAPVRGTVFGSRIFAERGVIRPAEPVMYIVPGDQPLHVSVRIDPLDVDQVFAGQEVSLVFSAFDRATTPEGRGQVQFVSADAANDEMTGEQFYKAIVRIHPESRSALGDLKLLPGMPVETFIRTETRTPLTYLVQPLKVYFSRALREE